MIGDQSTDGKPTDIQPKDFVVREFETSDIDQVAAIEAEVAADPWSRSLFEAEFDVAPAARHWLVAERTTPSTAQLLAFAGVMLSVDEAHIMNMGVLRQWQRRGIASTLLSKLLKHASDAGATSATLEVRASNISAIGLYKRFGFASAGRRPGYYQDGEDAEIMWVHGLYRPDFQELLKSKLGVEAQ